MDEKKQAWDNNFHGKHIRAQIGPNPNQLLLFGGNILLPDPAAESRPDPEPQAQPQALVSECAATEQQAEQTPPKKRRGRPPTRRADPPTEAPQAGTPVIVEPVIVEPVIVEPVIVEPVIVEPVIVEPVIVEPVIPPNDPTVVPTAECAAPDDAPIITIEEPSANVANATEDDRQSDLSEGRQSLETPPALGSIDRVEFFLRAWLERMRRGLEQPESPTMHAVNYGAMSLGTAQQQRPLQNGEGGQTWVSVDRALLVAMTVEAALDVLNDTVLSSLRVDLRPCCTAMSNICKAMQPARAAEIDAMLKAAHKRIDAKNTQPESTEARKTRKKSGGEP